MLMSMLRLSVGPGGAPLPACSAGPDDRGIYGAYPPAALLPNGSTRLTAVVTFRVDEYRQVDRRSISPACVLPFLEPGRLCGVGRCWGISGCRTADSVGHSRRPY